ncbi:hypothetical protein SUGI_1006840 [Cryptomeria japonica]|nr:hypothetical protein SUGI_1006840 [Cryptomeria japonica]
MPCWKYVPCSKSDEGNRRLDRNQITCSIPSNISNLASLEELYSKAKIYHWRLDTVMVEIAEVNFQYLT